MKMIFIFLTGGFMVLFSGSKAEDNQEWKQNAANMVEEQIVARGITDKDVVDAMKNTPRHKFMPENVRGSAYGDHPLPIGYEQTISQPYIVALMTELLDLTGTERVLEIGTGSGYQAAILSRLADSVYTIEIVKELADRAEETLHESGYDNVYVKHGDGYEGWEEFAPFDRIILTAAPPEVPPKLIEQLAVGGTMILPVGELSQDLVEINKTEQGTTRNVITGVRFVPMVRSGKKD